jgi:RimJ/RimL family protein N-acetyltransferase
MEPATGLLARDPLRNIVLLKHLQAYPGHTRLHHVARDGRHGFLVLLDAGVTSWDRAAYPAAAFIVLVSSDGPDLTRALLTHVPRGVGLVFKLNGEADRAAVARDFALERRMRILSFTAPSDGPAEPVTDPEIRIGPDPGAAAFALFAAQDHARSWLAPMLADGRAFACVAGPEHAPHAVCFAYENWPGVWEIGGVFTPETARRRGHGVRVVRSALGALGRRACRPRYQVHERNIASIRLAEAAGLRPFLHLTHYVHTP